MLQVKCSGPPHQIGFQHGSIAKVHITRSLRFYETLFQSKCGMSWSEVRTFAARYTSYLTQNYPQYVAEITGIAAGAGVAVEDILALNVRTEIAYGAFNDGCTAVSWLGPTRSILGQNWDWNVEQAENLIWLRIQREDGLRMEMVTEAGIIGKIGLNSRGVGCTLNALKAKGVHFGKVPCHLALRVVLDSESRDDAVGKLERAGVASACHILIADETGGMGLECSSEDIVRVEMDDQSIITHTNHFIRKHKKSVLEADWLPDTHFRLARIGELIKAARDEGPSKEIVEKFFKDETEGSGAAICRFAGKDGIATLFSIVMDLGERSANVLIGRPSEPKERLILSP